jgi:hypothetical protein
VVSETQWSSWYRFFEQELYTRFLALDERLREVFKFVEGGRLESLCITRLDCGQTTGSTPLISLSDRDIKTTTQLEPQDVEQDVSLGIQL